MNVQREFAELFQLPPAERPQLFEDLWDSLIPQEAVLPIPDWFVNSVSARSVSTPTRNLQ